MKMTDFDEAIAAHAAWKMKLATYIAKPDKSLDPSRVGVDNNCALGKWIHGEGGKTNKTQDFEELKKAHAEFHREAAEIIKKADSGLSVKADVALGSDSKYSKLSSRITILLMKMKNNI